MATSAEASACVIGPSVELRWSSRPASSPWKWTSPAKASVTVGPGLGSRSSTGTDAGVVGAADVESVPADGPGGRVLTYTTTMTRLSMTASTTASRTARSAARAVREAATPHLPLTRLAQRSHCA